MKRERGKKTAKKKKPNVHFFVRTWFYVFCQIKKKRHFYSFLTDGHQTVESKVNNVVPYVYIYIYILFKCGQLCGAHLNPIAL